MVRELTTTRASNLRLGRTWLQRVLGSNAFAWCVSIGLHAALFLAFCFVVLRPAAAVRWVIIPEARLAAAPGPAEPVENKPLQLTGPPGESPGSEQPQAVETVIAAEALGDMPSLALPGPEPVPAAAMALANQAAGAAGPQAPVSSFFGQTGNAYKVVYVVDTSASLMIYIDDIIRQVRDSIRALVPTQRFNIVLARPRKVEELTTRRLVPAISRYKREAEDFLATVDRVPKPGKADPIEAMRRAFAAGPELIYFLSDGDYADIEADLERELLSLNARRQVCITTIGFHPPREAKGRPEILLRIAQAHNGHFRLVEIK